MLFTTNSFFCNASLAPQFIVANHASSANDRSRSPKAGDKGEVAELDEKFVELWAKHVEPKMLEKNKEFENAIKQVVGTFVEREVDRLEKKLTLVLQKLSLQLKTL